MPLTARTLLVILVFILVSSCATSAAPTSTPTKAAVAEVSETSTPTSTPTSVPIVTPAAEAEPQPIEAALTSEPLVSTDVLTVSLVITNTSDRVVDSFTARIQFDDQTGRPLRSIPIGSSSYMPPGRSLYAYEEWEIPLALLMDADSKPGKIAVENLIVKFQLDQVTWDDGTTEFFLPTPQVAAKVGTPIQLKLTNRERRGDFRLLFYFEVTNSGEKDIDGFAGTARFLDKFDRPIFEAPITFETFLRAGKTTQWSGELPTSPGIDELAELSDMRFSDLGFDLVLQTVIFADGTKEHY